MERIGPFELGSERVSASGSRFFEANSPDGSRVLLQVARLRAVADEEERALRHKYERSLASRTAALIDEPALGVRAHAVVDAEEGTRLVYWALAWTGDLVQGVLPRTEWSTLARDLLERLARRHSRGRFEPNLCESLIAKAADAYEIIGIPLALDPAWLAANASPIRNAPEETAGPVLSGDLWRLGRTLEALAGLLEGADRAFVADLTHGDPKLRPRNALDAAVRFRALEHERALSHADRDGPVTDWGRAVEEPDHTPSGAAPRLKTLEDMQPTDPDPALPPGVAQASGERVDSGLGPKPPPAIGQEAITRELRPRGLSGLRGEVPAVDPSVAQSPEASENEYERFGTDLTAMPTEQAVRSGGRLLPFLPRPQVPPPPPPIEGETDPAAIALRAGRIEGREPGAVEAAAVAWAPAMLPEGASPWSEVVKPRPAGGRPGGDFPGFEGELPEVVEQTLLDKRITLPPPPITPSARPAPAVGSTAATSHARVALGIVATLAIFGAMALVVRSRPRPIEALAGLVATPVNEVIVDARPSGATVVAERDGQVLGHTPLRFLVPPGAEAPILLTAAGYEPQRLFLPERGRLVAELAMLPASSCELQIEGTRGYEIEGIGADVGPGPTYRVRGAALVRVKDPERAQVQGARIVRCPEVSGVAPRLRFGQGRTPAAVRVTHPPGASAELNGRALGVLPASRTTDRAFSLVRVVDRDGRSLERWVPTVTDVEIQMPEPVNQRAQIFTRDENVELASAPPVAGAGTIAEAPALHDKKSRTEELAKRAARLLAEGQAAQAQSALDACLGLDRKAAECHRVFGTLYRKQNNHRKAAEHFSRYLELAPDSPDAPVIRGVLQKWQ